MIGPAEINRRASAAGPPFGLYLIIIYSVVLLSQLPFRLPLPESLPLGPLTLEGNAAVAGLVMWSAAWAVMLIGLFVRRRWGYHLALVLFGAHMVLVIGNSLRWLSESGLAPGVSWQVAVWPGLQLLCTDALAVAYLYERKSIFVRGLVAREVVA